MDFQHSSRQRGSNCTSVARRCSEGGFPAVIPIKRSSSIQMQHPSTRESGNGRSSFAVEDGARIREEAGATFSSLLLPGNPQTHRSRQIACCNFITTGSRSTRDKKAAHFRLPDRHSRRHDCAHRFSVADSDGTFRWHGPVDEISAVENSGGGYGCRQSLSSMGICPEQNRTDAHRNTRS